VLTCDHGSLLLDPRILPGRRPSGSSPHYPPRTAARPGMLRACFINGNRIPVVIPQGLKPLVFRPFPARLKSCPDTKRIYETLSNYFLYSTFIFFIRAWARSKFAFAPV
jgi:hypothetical protein